MPFQEITRHDKPIHSPENTIYLNTIYLIMIYQVSTFTQDSDYYYIEKPYYVHTIHFSQVCMYLMIFIKSLIKCNFQQEYFFKEKNLKFPSSSMTDRSSIPQKWRFSLLPLYAQSRINFKSYYGGLEIVMV